MIATGDATYHTSGTGFYMVIEPPDNSILIQENINVSTTNGYGVIYFNGETPSQVSRTAITNHHSNGDTLRFYNGSTLTYTMSAGSWNGGSYADSEGWMRYGSSDSNHQIFLSSLDDLVVVGNASTPTSWDDLDGMTLKVKSSS